MTPFITTTDLDIHLKDGYTMKAGTEVRIMWPTSGGNPRITEQSTGDTFTFSNRTVARMLGLDIPTLEDLEHDDLCTSVLGEVVEPEGHDEYGSPSWMIVFGLI